MFWGPLVPILLGAQRLSEANQILRLDANDAAARTIDVRNEKERDRHHFLRIEEPIRDESHSAKKATASTSSG
jgi:hypothetical protein